MPRLGVVGSLVWDTIHGPDGGDPFNDWGGIAYSMAAWGAAAPPGWSMVPIVKVGADLRDAADGFLATLGGVCSAEFVRTVPESNNRVHLFYHDRSRRCERLTGGVPGWTAEEIARAALSCDALYVNFISGWELDLDGVSALEHRLSGPSWCDVHSLILGVGSEGVREPRPLADRAEWLGAFNLVQVNEDELEMLSPSVRGRRSQMEDVLSEGPDGVFVTLGSGGVEWVVRPGTRWLPEAAHVATGDASVETIAPLGATDPTGCGDVWGITCFAALLGDVPLPEAVRRANRLAAATAAEQGTSGLAGKLVEVVRTTDVER